MIAASTANAFTGASGKSTTALSAGAGDCVVVAVAAHYRRTVNSVSDGASSDSYHSLGTVQSTWQTTLSVWLATDVEAASSLTVTVDLSGYSPSVVAVGVITGCSSNPVDAVGQGATSSGSATASAGVTTASSSDLVVLAVAVATASTLSAQTSGLTLVSQAEDSGGSKTEAGGAFSIVAPTAGTYSPSVGISSSSAWAALAFGISSGNASGPPPPPPNGPEVTAHIAAMFDSNAGNTDPAFGTAAGETIVVFVATHFKTTVTALSDSAHDSYSLVSTAAGGSSTGLSVWLAKNVSSSSNVVVAVTRSRTTPAVILVDAVGQVAGNPEDGTPGTYSSSNSRAATATANPSVAGDLVLMGISATGTPGVTPESSGLSLGDRGQEVAGSNAETGADLAFSDPSSGSTALSAELSSSEAVASVTVALAGGQSGGGPPPPPPPPPPPADHGAIQHVVTIIMENQPLSAVLQSGPYERYLWGTYGNATNYYSACHFSAPNYLALTSGETYQCGSDRYTTYATTEVGDLLEARHLTWAGYFETMPRACDTSNDGEYVVHHNPFIYYTDVVNNKTRCDAHDLPSSAWTSQVASGTLLNYSFYVPNNIDDGDNSSIATADSWLNKTLSPILNTTDPTLARTVAHTVFFILYDESALSDTSGYTAGGTKLDGGHIYCVAVSPFTRATTDRTDSSHFDELSTVEWLLGLDPTGNEDGTSAFPAMKALFDFNGSAPPPVKYAVTGSVLSENGSVLGGATLNWSNATKTSPVGLNDSGGFSVQLPNGTYSFSASAPGFVPAEVNETVDGAPVSDVSLRLTPLPPTLYTVSGTVLAPNGTVPTGVALSWSNASESGGIPVDGSGGFSKKLPDGTYSFSATAPGFVPAGANVTVNGGPVSGVALVLHPALYRVSGTVLAVNGTVPPDLSFAWTNASENVTVPVNSTGGFVIKLSDGAYNLTAWAPGFNATWYNLTVADANVSGISLVLTPYSGGGRPTFGPSAPGQPIATLRRGLARTP